MSSPVPAEFRDLLIEGLGLFDQGHYHDAHDVLEEIWLDEVGHAKRLVQALIQLSVGLYHRERGNRRGARKLLQRAGEIFAERPDDLWGFDVPALSMTCRKLADEVERQETEPDPIYDPALVPSFEDDRQRLR